MLFTTDIQQIADYINEQSAPNPHLGISVRVTSDKFAHDPISGEGSRLVGGRFNIRLGLKDCPDLPDGIQAIYLADSPETALREANLIRQPSRIDRLLDDEGYTYFLIRYELSRVLDLTLGNIFVGVASPWRIDNYSLERGIHTMRSISPLPLRELH